MIGLIKATPGPGKLILAERPDPQPGRGEVVLAVHGAGVCGTDLHIEAGEYDSSAPVILGHEVSGVVQGLGPGVDRAWLHERVVTETFFSTCGHCVFCREGRPNLCPDRRSIGTHVDGGFAPTIVVPVRNLHRIPLSLSSHAATLIEPLACVCHCMLNPSVINPGDNVVVVGPGPMGQLAAQVARTLGANVVVLGRDTDRDRLEVAQSLGFATTSSRSDVGEVDVAIEASGTSGGIATALQSARRGGRFVQLGIAGANVEVPLDYVLLKELVVSTGFASSSRAWRNALWLVENGRVELEPLVSSVAPLSQWETVFADLRQGQGMKAVFDPRMS